MSEDLGSYLKRSPFYHLFTDDDFQDFLVEGVPAGEDVSDQIPDDLQNLLVEMDVLFEMEEGGVEVNQHHEVYDIMSAPHIERVLNREAVATLHLAIHKTYLPCLPVQSIVDLTGFDEDEVDEAIDTLYGMRMVRRTMVGEGVEDKRNVVESAGEVIEQVDNLVELFNENEDVTLSEFDETLADIEQADRDSERLIGMTQSEFRTRAHDFVNKGINEIRTTDNLSTIEPGSSGVIINKESDLSSAFAQFDLYMTRYVTPIHEYVGIGTDDE